MPKFSWIVTLFIMAFVAEGSALGGANSSTIYRCGDDVNGTASTLKIGNGPDFHFVFETNKVVIEGQMARLNFKLNGSQRYTWTGQAQHSLVLNINQAGEASLFYSGFSESIGRCTPAI